MLAEMSSACSLLKRAHSLASCKAYGSYDELLDHPGITAVYIPLPSALHVEWVRKAAAKKLHVLLEKPVAIDDESLEAIFRACEEAGVVLMDGTMWWGTCM